MAAPPPSTLPWANHPWWGILVTETSTTNSAIEQNLGSSEGDSVRVNMTRYSQSHQEAAQPTTLLTSKQTNLIGTWNVRTMYETGKTAQVAAEMRRYHLAVLGLCETRWLQSGQIRLTTGETLIYSGHTNEGAIHTEGVGIMIAKEKAKALIEWEAVSARIITARFNAKARKVTVIQCYAPTNEAEEDTKNDFYDMLQQVIDKQAKKDIIILMGDLNAKVGKDNSGKELVMGKHGVGDMNENGEKFGELCAFNDLVIGGTVYPHKEVHKVTWVSPDHKTENQIDHICISRKFRRSMLDVRNKRGADAATDHHLVVGKVRLKLRKYCQATENKSHPRYNVSLLQERETKEAFKVTLRNKYEALMNLQEEDETTVEQDWSQAKKIWHETCEETLGRKTREHKEWITRKTLQKIENRRQKKQIVNRSNSAEAKRAAQQEYMEVHKEVKRSIKQDKKMFIEKLAQQAEEAAN